jgi:hypothetical protein
MIAAFMRLGRHERGIHAVSAGLRELRELRELRRVTRLPIFRATLRPISVSGRARTAKLSATHDTPCR